MSEQFSDMASSICATLAGFETVYFQVTPGVQNGTILEPRVTIIQQRTYESGKVYRIFISVRAMLFRTDDAPVEDYPREVINSLLHTLHERIANVLVRIDVAVLERLRARQQEVAKRTREFLYDVPEVISVSLTSPLACYLKACEAQFRDDPQRIHDCFTVPQLYTRIAAYIANPLRNECCDKFGQHSLSDALSPSETDPDIIRIGAVIDYNSDQLGKHCWWANHDAELPRMSNVTYCTDRPFDLP